MYRVSRKYRYVQGVQKVPLRTGCPESRPKLTRNDRAQRVPPSSQTIPDLRRGYSVYHTANIPRKFYYILSLINLQRYTAICHFTPCLLMKEFLENDPGSKKEFGSAPKN